jgi:hypothetical protein
MVVTCYNISISQHATCDAQLDLSEYSFCRWATNLNGEMSRWAGDIGVTHVHP